MSDPIFGTTTDSMSIWEVPNPWARISEIVAKVGVSPQAPGSPASVYAVGADGRNYDIFEVVSVVLDKIAEATNEQRNG